MHKRMADMQHPAPLPDPLEQRSMESLRALSDPAAGVAGAGMARDVVIDCGWGRLIFGHTFDDLGALAAEIQSEAPGRRDVAIYIRDPHVLLSLAPQDLFLDPSHTFRLRLADLSPATEAPRGFHVRPLRTAADAEAVRRIWLACRMVPAGADFCMHQKDSPVIRLLVAQHDETGEIVGVVFGVDHRRACDDVDNGASLWALAVDPQTALVGVGEALVRALADLFIERGRAFLDLSVMHDNAQAIALYQKLGFQRVPVFCVKNKNSINEALFVGPLAETGLNIYATILVDEARRRGIGVEVLDADAGYFALSLGARRIVCRESLSELTSAVAMSRCDDKAVTRRALTAAGLNMPAQREAGDEAADRAFLAKHGSVVVKPARGEQGAGVSVDITTEDELAKAVKRARRSCDRVLIEEFVSGADLRIIVIGGEVVAAAVRRPATIRGDGRHTVGELIEKQSRRRAAATGGESKIPVDDETERCIHQAGKTMDSVLPSGESLTVRKTANLHTGGTIEDVTPDLHPALAQAAVAAAAALDIPVVGFDFLVPAVNGPAYVIIEANERPGLANHEPQPTAARFVDLLFPQSRVVGS